MIERPSITVNGLKKEWYANFPLSRIKILDDDALELDTVGGTHIVMDTTIDEPLGGEDFSAQDAINQGYVGLYRTAAPI